MLHATVKCYGFLGNDARQEARACKVVCSLPPHHRFVPAWHVVIACMPEPAESADVSLINPGFVLTLIAGVIIVQLPNVLKRKDAEETGGSDGQPEGKNNPVVGLIAVLVACCLSGEQPTSCMSMSNVWMALTVRYIDTHHALYVNLNVLNNAVLLAVRKNAHNTNIIQKCTYNHPRKVSREFISKKFLKALPRLVTEH